MRHQSAIAADCLVRRISRAAWRRLPHFAARRMPIAAPVDAAVMFRARCWRCQFRPIIAMVRFEVAVAI